MTGLPWWQRILTAIASFKIAAGIVSVATALEPGAPRLTGLHALVLAHAIVYGAAAWALIVGGDRDRRATTLGLAFLLTASVFVEGPLRQVTGVAAGFTLLRALSALTVDAFTPYFLWRFVGEFPRGPDFGLRLQVTRAAARISMVVGVTLLVLNLVPTTGPATVRWPALATVSAFLSQATQGSGYWPVIYGLSLPALGLLWSGLSMVSRDERRRVTLLTVGLLVCAGPTIAWVFAYEMWPLVGEVLPLRVVRLLLYPLLLFLPLWTSYVVLVHHALDVRLVARRAVQYALARQTMLVFAAVPFAILVFELYDMRSRSVSNLLFSPAGASLGGLVLLAIGAVRGHRATLDWLDRRYFREEYDARQILAELVERCRRARSQPELSEVLRSELERALHPESTRLMVFDEGEEVFRSSTADVPVLNTQRPFLRLAATHDTAFDTDLELHGAKVAGLPDADLEWLADSGAKLCAPLKNTEGDLIGLLLLGGKKSDLPYSNEDRHLLSAVASAAALCLGSLAGESMRRSDDPAMESATGLAVECVLCGAVYPARRERCERCAGALEAVNLPLLVAGKFRLVERIGDGAMGVVYRGIDVQLARAVAIKTLPRLTAAAASRLRREARIIAAVSHPNLASIYSVESWRGMPMLVLELLTGGTLTERLGKGAIPSAEALPCGVALAAALGAVHRAGILHRDVKPSNIGFSADGVPKLLDFGVSRLLGRAQHDPASASDERVDVRAALFRSRDDLQVTTTTTDGRVVGTPLYLSPEAIDAMRPEPSFDVWSLCMVLYEMIAGRHPLRSQTVAELLGRISRCDVPDIRQHLPGADPSLAEFFHKAFSPAREVRPLTADALGQQLRALLGR